MYCIHKKRGLESKVTGGLSLPLLLTSSLMPDRSPLRDSVSSPVRWKDLTKEILLSYLYLSDLRRKRRGDDSGQMLKIHGGEIVLLLKSLSPVFITCLGSPGKKLFASKRKNVNKSIEWEKKVLSGRYPEMTL